MPNKNGILKGVSFKPEIRKFIIEKVMFRESNMKIDNYLSTKFGIIFFKFNTREEMNFYIDNLYDFIIIDID